MRYSSAGLGFFLISPEERRKASFWTYSLRLLVPGDLLKVRASSFDKTRRPRTTPH